MVLEKPAILGGKPIFNEFLPIIRPNLDKFAHKLSKKIEKILSSNMVSGVDIYTRELEERLCNILDVRNVIALSSCTSSMILTIQALGLKDKEIILPSFTFSATAHMLYWNRCKPKFVDVDLNTFNISFESIKKAINPSTGAILGVHLYGNPCDLHGLMEISEDYNIPLLIDGAHALGAEYRNKSIGALATATAYSASPTKLFSTIEGGFISTDNFELAETLRRSRNYGNYPDYTCKLPGFNARLSEINAIVGLVQIDELSMYIKNRNRFAETYIRELSKIPGLSFQKVDSGDLSTYKDFCIIVDFEKFGMNRNDLAKVLLKENIQTKFYFYPPIHQLDAFKGIATDKDLPNTTYLSSNVLSLPIFNYMEEIEICGIIEAIKKAHEYSSEIITSR